LSSLKIEKCSEIKSVKIYGNLLSDLKTIKKLVKLTNSILGIIRLEYLPTGLKIFDVCSSKYYENIQNGVQLSDELIDQEFGIQCNLLKLRKPEKFNGFG
ncbi:3718_t:CDS:2, partial [Gigaspora margarita]